MTADTADEGPATRFAASERWGEPDEQVGSVNDPRTREEHGIRYNEKWIYLLPGGDRRLVYWLRYDFCGSVRIGRDASVRAEPWTP